MSTKRTLYLLVTCCVEQTRFDILKCVIENIKTEQCTKKFDIEDDLIVFDNGSTIEGVVDLLISNFKTVYRSNVNEGFWSAINWVINNVDVHHKYDYIYIIESDHIHFALEKIEKIETFLNLNPNVGGVRCQEFFVSERHLYDKTLPLQNSRTYAWVNQINEKTKKRIQIKQTDTPDFYITDFLSQLHSVNRIHAMKTVFSKLEQISYSRKFSELDYQLLYYEIYPQFGIIDGGVFHAKLSWRNGSLAGSYCGADARDKIGYQETRISSITSCEKMYVKQI